jgi:hypothetical protein
MPSVGFPRGKEVERRSMLVEWRSGPGKLDSDFKILLVGGPRGIEVERRSMPVEECLRLSEM